MSFIQPFAFAAAALAGLIVLMYLLKLRRQQEPVSSTLLWLRTVEDLIANAPFQKLRQNLLMYLQIAALLAIVVALARPTMWLDRSSGLRRIILIDNSASMNATDGEGGLTRLEDAKRKALELVGNMTRGDQAQVQTFGGPPRVLQPFTHEQATLARAIRSVEPTEARGQIREALQLVRGVRKADENAHLTILSDGALGYLGTLIEREEQLEFIGVGRGRHNRGIVAFDVRESFERRGQMEVFAQVRNFGEAETQALVRCLVDDTLVGVKEATLPAGATQGFVFENIAQGSGRRLRLELGGEPDLLAADDVAHGVLRLEEPARVLLVSKGNFFLERALALAPGVEVDRIDPDKFDPLHDHRLAVFDNFSPAAIGPGRALFINGVPPLEGFAGGAALPAQMVLDWNRLHPVMRFVNLGGLAVTKSLELSAPEWMTLLVESERAGLVMAGEHQGYRIGVVAFDLFESDWPLQVSFPIFFTQMLDWLLGSGEGSVQATQHLTGGTVRIDGIGMTDRRYEVRGPAGQRWPLEANAEGTSYFNQTLGTGFYEVRAGDELVELFAVNLLAAEESDLAPRAELVAGEKQILAGAVTRQNREVWPWFVIGCLGLLALEWQLYGRRSWL